MRAPKAIMAAMASLLVVAACGGPGGTLTSAPAATTPGIGATPASTRNLPDPCSLLTQADIKTATGSDYGPPQADPYGHCRWFFGTSTVDEGKGMVSVSFAAPGTTLASVKSGVGSAGVDVIVGGHPAYWDAISFGPSMWVDLGTAVLVVGLDPLPVGGQAMVHRMAELAVAKL